ncbi:hypothetical protein CTAYLR_007462 [Chrysophaeum taylorii]|uniref:Polygalacturonase n=1 Tax=Chrysophaeum taylorii TaxID=2483200 RepID=A0AAD7XJH5_9STRA|nr:hypothetical protein CTAYLR_007462 [Chrysophaeum taylorii]
MVVVVVVVSLMIMASLQQKCFARREEPEEAVPSAGDKMWKTIARYERRAKAAAAARHAESLAEYAQLLREVAAGDAEIFSVMDYGAAGDGETDDREALVDAVVAAQLARRREVRRTVVHLPQGRTFKISRLALEGMQGIEVRIDGKILAPPMDDFQRRLGARQHRVRRQFLSPERQRMQFSVIEIAQARGVVITGLGGINGNGRAWWRVRKREPARRAPVLLLVRDSDDVLVSHIDLRDSPFYHVVVLGSRRVKLARLNISSPPASVNTDGIDILASSDVLVKDCWVSTGDDNVAIKEASSAVHVDGGTFYRGHGLSIGSLGEGGTSASVSDVLLANVAFVKTSNAARVKTWQGGRGVVSNITFANLTVAAVGTPIVVDQFYCPQSQHPATCGNSSKAVAIRHLVIDGVRGWHTSGVAAMLHCSEAVPCRVSLANLQLEPAPGCSNVVRCLNVFRLRSTDAPTSQIRSACARGDEMHGFRLDLNRRQRRQLAKNFSCVHP